MKFLYSLPLKFLLPLAGGGFYKYEERHEKTVSFSIIAFN